MFPFTGRLQRRQSQTGNVSELVSSRSLRSRWTRAFAGMVGVLLLGGLVSAAGTRHLASNYSVTAHTVEEETSDLATLRSDIVNDMVATANAAPTPGQRSQHLALELAISKRFTDGAATFRGASSRQLLLDSNALWTQLHRTIDSAGSMPVAQRLLYAGNLVARSAPPILTAVDRVGEAGRAAARKELARNAALEHAVYLGMLVMTLLELLLMWRLARRLMTEVLKPVSELRASADLLAAGRLNHRAIVARTDEIGDLAGSFNAMANAISGSQQTLTLQAHHDALTGLDNRAGFLRRMEQVLGRRGPDDGRQAVLFIDLDDFKYVNDLLGHAAGDELLRVIAARLTAVLRPDDIVARLGGDEFVLLLDGIDDEAAASALASRLGAAVAEPVLVMGHQVQVGASIGLSMVEDDHDLEALMQQADTAMYSAKGQGKGRVERYDTSLRQAVVNHQELKTDVIGAAERGELLIDYQPVIELASGTLVGVEALVRWQHPTRGLLPPSAFIELAEEVGAITSIGTWVLRKAAEQMRLWQRRYRLPRLKLSVNVSVRQLETPLFAELVIDILGETALDPSTLVLEVTESVLANPRGGAAQTLQAIRQVGVRIAVDDFGTGYASIGYLKQMPVDILKVDRSFVSGPDEDGRLRSLLEGIVALGHHLGMDVVPEGIERPEELDLLMALGCRSGQGFLLAKPMPPADIDQWLTTGPPHDQAVHQIANTPLSSSRLPTPNGFLDLPHPRGTDTVSRTTGQAP